MKSTDWESLRSPKDNNNTFADTVCSYINLCEQVCLPTKTTTRYNNTSPGSPNSSENSGATENRHTGMVTWTLSGWLDRTSRWPSDRDSSSECEWITDFLTNSKQQVQLGSHLSTPLTTNTGAPQGCILHTCSHCTLMTAPPATLPSSW